MFPAQQHLHPLHAAGHQINNGLVDQAEFIAFHGGTQFGGHFTPQLPCVQHDRFERAHQPGAFLLRHIHGGVGAQQHVLGRLARFGYVDADARARPDIQFLHQGPQAQGLLDAFSGRPGSQAANGRKQYSEFIPAQPCHGAARRNGGQQPGRHFLQHLVTGLVPEAVVDFLEAIQVDHEDSRRSATAVPAFQGQFHPLHQGNPVAQAGQRIRERHLLHLPVGFPQLLRPRFNPVLHVLVHVPQLLGKEVDPGTDGVDLVAGGRNRDLRGEVAGRDADDAFDNPCQTIILGL